ncbi:hypothetical protein BJ170DRAFT_596356 [Xylariales sp. AK1849]|nr:hypothetical protein BJ170DRAFT_596356 [Xylariales sp. AK1849]
MYSLEMAGTSPETARPSIVISCLKDDFKGLEALFDERIKERLYCGKKSFPFHLFRSRKNNKSPVAPFQLVYYRTNDSPIVRMASDVPLRAHLDSGLTCCGGIIQCQTRTATLALTIRVDDFYGVLTVDHLFPPPSSSTVASVSESSLRELATDSDSSTLNDEDLEDLGDLWVAAEDEYLDVEESFDDVKESDTIDPIERETNRGSSNTQEEWERIPPLIHLDYQEPYLDWALTKPIVSPPMSRLVNVIFDKDREGDELVLEKMAEEPRCHRASVHILSGIRGLLSGRLLANSVMIGSAPGQEPCEVWRVVLDTDVGILKGECGSVIVDKITNEVYGHVVGSSPFGHAYIVPLQHVMQQIKTCFQTSQVDIFSPSSISAQAIESKREGHRRLEITPSIIELDSSTRCSDTGDDRNATSSSIPLRVGAALSTTNMHIVDDTRIVVSWPLDRQPITRWLETHPSSLEESTSIHVVTWSDRGSEQSEVSDLGEEFYLRHRAPLIEPISSPVEQALGSRIENEENAILTTEEQLRGALVEPYTGSMGFIPRDRLAVIMNKIAVRLNLSQCFSSSHTDAELEAYTDFICRKEASLRRLFAILILIDRADQISKFIQENISDDDLPLMSVTGTKPGFRELRRRKAEAEELMCFRRWKQHEIESFSRWQWAMSAPFFSKGKNAQAKFYPLWDEVILPFTENSRRETKHSLHSGEIHQGGYGTVFRVKIHPEHHDFTVNRNMKFAIKRLYSSSKDAFKHEVEMLKRFSGTSSQHLISLLGTYSHQNNYYLIFPWAEADLYRYWRKINPKPQNSGPMITWFARQSAGIAEGLSLIHSGWSGNEGQISSKPEVARYGRHGDIKPENILWFEDDTEEHGKLVITDFGLSSYNSEKSRSNVPARDLAHSLTYRPPEVDVNGKVSRAYDIWSLGCVYHELVTWYLGGLPLLMDFAGRRCCGDDSSEIREDKFFIIVRDEGTLFTEVKPAVAEVSAKSSDNIDLDVTNKITQMIRGLHAHDAASCFVHDFLDLIQHHLLKVEPTERMSSQLLYEELHRMAEKCRVDADYAAKPDPRHVPGHKTIQYAVSESYPGMEGRKSRSTEMTSRERFRIYSTRKSRRSKPVTGTLAEDR